MVLISPLSLSAKEWIHILLPLLKCPSSCQPSKLLFFLKIPAQVSAPQWSFHKHCPHPRQGDHALSEGLQCLTQSSTAAFYHTVQSIRRRSISPTGLGELCEPGTGAYSPLQCFVPGQVPGAEWRREDSSNSSNTRNTPRLSEIVGMGGQLYYIFFSCTP